MTGVRDTTWWTVSPTLSSATFTVRNLGFRRVTGTVPVTTARVEVDAHGRPVRLEAELDLAGVDTAHVRRDRDLRAPRLLDTDRFPVVRFRGGPTSAAAPAGDGWVVPGVLTVSGDATHAVAVTAFDRTAAGVRAPRLLIGRRVDVRIDAVLRPA